jgi:integrase
VLHIGSIGFVLTEGTHPGAESIVYDRSQEASGEEKSEAVEALNRERRTYLERRLRFAERWEETWRKRPEARDLVFPSETGGPMNRNSLHRRHFKPLARKAGLPKEARLYTLRHTFATLWMESNEPVKVLQEILGHSRIDQTMNTYAHVMPHIQADAFGRFSKRFSQG